MTHEKCIQCIFSHNGMSIMVSHCIEGDRCIRPVVTHLSTKMFDSARDPGIMLTYGRWKQGDNLRGELPPPITMVPYCRGTAIRSPTAGSPVAFHTMENGRKVVILSDFSDFFTFRIINLRTECYERLVAVDNMATFPRE